LAPPKNATAADADRFPSFRASPHADEQRALVGDSSGIATDDHDRALMSTFKNRSGNVSIIGRV